MLIESVATIVLEVRNSKNCYAFNMGLCLKLCELMFARLSMRIWYLKMVLKTALCTS